MHAFRSGSPTGFGGQEVDRQQRGLRQRGLDAGAAAAVSQSKAASILAVGVTAVEGDFERDDIVRILSPEGAPLGVGRISCDSATARRNLGRKGLKPLIHCDYLYLE